MTHQPEASRTLRSARWFDKSDLPGFVHRSTLTPTGLHRGDFNGKPVIGILTSWSDINPCNLNLRYLANEVRKGVLEAGGMAFELPMLSLSENLIKPTSFLFRNLLALDAEEMIRAYPFDAVVLLGGCDKTIPALVMGAASVNVPFIVVSSGPSTPRNVGGRVQGTGTTVWKFVDEMRAGRVDAAAFARFEESIMTTPGHCSEMGTASTVGVVCEALGIAMSGSAMVPATDGRRALAARRAGSRIVGIAREGGPLPRDLLTEQAFENAITALCAVGGSTNVILHLLAIAGRIGARIDLQTFDRIARRTPIIADLQPSGQHLVSAMYEAGGVPALLRELAPLLSLDALTVDGRRLRELIADAPVADQCVIRALDRPVKAGVAIAVLKGNLAPHGAVLKASAADGALFKHTGRAIVFESVQDVADRIDDPALAIDESSVLVLRGAGPVGAAMPEWGMLPLPRRLLSRGVRDLLRISDARMSGTAYGTAILHVAPEAAVGGPLALVQTGDRIRLNVEARELILDVPDDVLSARRAAWSAPPMRHARGYRQLYAQHVTQAHEGSDFDFLRGGEPTSLPEGLFNGWVGGW